MIGTVERIPGVALMHKDPTAEWEYSGETKVFWDGQATEPIDQTGKATLICDKGHEWTTEVL